jgi:hypothetical protein
LVQWSRLSFDEFGGHRISGVVAGGESEPQWLLVVVMQARTQKMTSSATIQPPRAPPHVPAPQDVVRRAGRFTPVGDVRDGGSGL